MPTPVSAARQCLTQESASVLDEAAAVARRRGHAQTTSIHMVSSLLSLPNSSLREACTKTRNNAYSSRVQFKALELSLGVSLDRLPSSQASRSEEPPVSNSLMAAVKRSQANLRRQPKNFTFYQQQQQQQQWSSSSSVPVVKVELQNLVLSILDDPLVSRVFGEAGFRSCDIKMATLRPGSSFYPSHMFGCTPRYKRPRPPLFLCNLSGSDGASEVGGKSFGFLFTGCFSGDEDSRRIGEVMVRDKKRSPLLLGISAGNALRSFLETVQTKIRGVLPDGLRGLTVICIKDEILRYLNGDCDEGPLQLRFEEVERMAESVAGAGLLLNCGDLNAFVGDGVAVDSLRFLVSRIGRLIEYGGKLRLIGAASTYDVYFKILNEFPTIEQDWDLEVLPIITSIKFSVGGSYPRSSLMESFVPLGGFFSMPPEMKSPSSNACQYAARCHLCNEKYEQEAAALVSSRGGLCSSVAERYQSNFPSWMQTVEVGPQSGSSSIKGTDDRLLLNAKVTALQKKWDEICEQHHFNRSFSKGYTPQFGNDFPRVLGFQVEDKGEKASDSNNCSKSPNEQGMKNASSSLSTDIQRSSSYKELSSLDMLSKANNVLSESGDIPLPFKGDSNGCKDHGSVTASVDDGHTSQTSATSVTTDLGLGIISASVSKEPEKALDQSRLDLVSLMHSDVKDLYKALVDRVDQQEEAISSIIRTISHCQKNPMDRHGLRRRNIWINLQGGGSLSKKKLGLALAEILYGSTERLIYVDLSFQDEITHIDTLFNSQVRNKYDLTMRGTVVDYLVEKLNKKPSVVFFENIDKADHMVQNSLSQAVKSGRFRDFCGQEVSVSNCIFLGATRFSKECQSMSDSGKCTEEDIVSTKGSPIQILIRFDLNDDPTSECDMFSMNKRKLVGRDRRINQCGSLEVVKRTNKTSSSYLNLNLPAEGSEICNTTESETDSSSENLRSWLEDFDRQVDQTVVFKPFDFETFAEKLLKNMTECLHNIFGFECLIEIEPKVMQQILGAAYLSGKKKADDWIQRVLRQGFEEAMGKFSINAHSILKLVTFEGDSEEQIEGLLPARIIMK